MGKRITIDKASHSIVPAKKVSRSEWNAEDARKQSQLVRQLETKDLNFGQLRTKLKWAKQTLAVYVQSLIQKQWITKEKKGREIIYSLVRDNADVAKMLGWNSPVIRVRGRIRLDKISEEKFIEDWIRTMRFEFLNILQDYLLIGQKDEASDDCQKIRRFTEGHCQGLVDAVTFYGDLLAERIRRQTFKPARVLKVRKKLHQEIKKEFVH